MSSIATKNIEPFHLEREIESILHSLTANLNSITQIKFTHDEALPAIKADHDSLRLSFVTMIEFGMKYCDKGQIELNTKFEGFTHINNYESI